MTINKPGCGFPICFGNLQYVSYLETGSCPTVKGLSDLVPPIAREYAERQSPWNTLTIKQYLCITSSARPYFVLSGAGTGCSHYNYKQEHIFIHDRLQMQDPHLGRTRGPGRQTDLLCSFQSCPGGFLDLLILDYNTTKPSQKKNHHTTPHAHMCKKNRNPKILWSISRRDVQSVTSPTLELLSSRGGNSRKFSNTGVLATKNFTHSGRKPSFKTLTWHVPCQYQHSKPSSCDSIWVCLRSKCYSYNLGHRMETFRKLVYICLRWRFKFVQVQPVPLNLWPHLFTLLQKSTARSNSWWQSHVFFH